MINSTTALPPPTEDDMRPLIERVSRVCTVFAKQVNVSFVQQVHLRSFRILATYGTLTNGQKVQHSSSAYVFFFLPASVFFSGLSSSIPHRLHKTI